MSIDSKAEELQFHADRVKETTTRVLKAVILDPRLSPEEKLSFLTQISGVHVEMAEMIHSAIESGCYQAISQLSGQGGSKENTSLH